MFSFSYHKYFRFTDYVFIMPKLECLQWGSFSSIHKYYYGNISAEMFDKVICTTNAERNKGFDKNKGLQRHA